MHNRFYGKRNSYCYRLNPDNHPSDTPVNISMNQITQNTHPAAAIYVALYLHGLKTCYHGVVTSVLANVAKQDYPMELRRCHSSKS